MVQMSMQDMEVFLSEPRNATFATVSPNQSPQLTTVWFLYVWFSRNVFSNSYSGHIFVVRLLRV